MNRRAVWMMPIPWKVASYPWIRDTIASCGSFLSSFPHRTTKLCECGNGFSWPGFSIWYNEHRIKASPLKFRRRTDGNVFFLCWPVSMPCVPCISDLYRNRNLSIGCSVISKIGSSILAFIEFIIYSGNEFETEFNHTHTRKIQWTKNWRSYRWWLVRFVSAGKHTHYYYHWMIPAIMATYYPTSVSSLCFHINEYCRPYSRNKWMMAMKVLMVS